MGAGRGARSSKIPPLPPSPLPVASPPIAEIEDLTFAYDRNPVLHGIRMQIPRGKVVAIMGQSGCGKTTLLRILMAALVPTAGRALVLGEDTRALDRGALYALRRRMGMLFQFGALFTDMSVFDNVAFQMREHTDLPEEAIRDLALLKLEAVGLRGAAGLMPAELSGGMARRVALARAIALDPELILYDEPFTGLDPIAMGVVGRLIRQLNDTLGATSVVVTHDVTETLPLVDYVYFMADGRVLAEGNPAEVQRSGVPFVEQFVSGAREGPVAFHYPAPGYEADLGLAGRA
jgi:phospholipid/cholesterol/gamma-HCH transport system ATP-binding protein